MIKKPTVVQLLCWLRDQPWHCLFFVTMKQEGCVRAGRQAPSECQVYVTHKLSAVQSCADEYIFFFYSPPPCTAALKSDFPTIWCKILVLDGFSVICGTTSPVSWAAVYWNNPTPLRSFSLKSHPASWSKGLQGGGQRGQELDLSPKNTNFASGWCSGFWSLYLLECRLSCKSHVYCSSSFHRAH